LRNGINIKLVNVWYNRQENDLIHEDDESKQKLISMATVYYLTEYQDLIPGRGREGNLPLHPNITSGSGAHPASYPVGTGTRLIPCRLSGWGVKLNAHLHVVLRLRTHGAISPILNASSWHGAFLGLH
jgi:hypothetical protein